MDRADTFPAIQLDSGQNRKCWSRPLLTNPHMAESTHPWTLLDPDASIDTAQCPADLIGLHRGSIVIWWQSVHFPNVVISVAAGKEHVQVLCQ